MPFFNDEGGRVSFDCSALIDELRADIAEFGGDRLADVIAEVCAGVTIYKDYFLHDSEAPMPGLHPGEFWRRMTASALLVVYEEQNRIM